jgi:hypothetical protein
MIQLSNIQWLFLFKDKGVIARASIYVSLIYMSFSSLILLYNWTWWWYNARIYLSTISSLIHVMIYSLTYLRTSKGLSLGELIRAFYIFILVVHIVILKCYLHCYIIVFACFRWFMGLSYKVPICGILISGSQKTPFFHVFDVSGPSGYQMNRGKMHNHYFSRRKIMRERTRREEPRGPNGHDPRGQGIWMRGAYLFTPRAPFPF